MAYDPLSKSGGAKKGSGKSSPKAGPSSAPRSSGAFDPLSGKSGGGKGGSKKKGGKSFFGVRLPTVFGVDLPDIGVNLNTPGPVRQARDLVAGAAPNLARLVGTVGSELVPPAPWTPFTRGVAQSPRGWAGVEAETPMIAQITESVARTARQVPDTAVAVRPGGPGFGQSDLGQQIKEEGVLPTALAKFGDLSLLLGGVGLVGTAATGGRLAQAARLERRAGATSQAAGLGKTPRFDKLIDEAAKADVAGDAARAADLSTAAKQTLEAAELRTGVAGTSKLTRTVEKGTEGAFKLARGGDRIEAAPFLPTQKLIGAAGKGAKVAARSKLAAPAMARVEAAIARMAQKREIGDLHHENVTAPFQAEMHTFYQRHGIEDAARHLDADEQAAVYLTKSAEDVPARQLLDAVADLPLEVRPDVIARLFTDGDVTPAQIDLAMRFRDGTLPPKQQAKLQKAADAITATADRRTRETYVTGRGTSKPLSEAALAARRQRAAGKSADMDVAGVRDRKQAPIKERMENRADEANRLETETPEPAPLSKSQERRLAKDEERVRRSRAIAKEEQRRGSPRIAAAKRQLERDTAQAAARRAKFDLEQGQKADRAVERRLQELDRRNARDLDALDKAAQEAADDVLAAPPQDRPALRVGERASALALELASAHPEHASEFLALADDIATTKTKLEAKGIKTEFLFGGDDLGKDAAPPSTARLVQAKKLASERQRTSGKLSRSLKGQSEKHAREALDILHNEFRPKVAEAFGSVAGDELGRADHRFSTGDALAKALAERELLAWDPVTGKLLDAKDVTLDSAVLPKQLHETVTKYTATKNPGMALRVYDKATGKWKHTVLALSTRWHVGNIIGNAALSTLGAGISPAAIVGNIGEARRLVKQFERGGDIPVQHQAALRRLIAAGYHNPDLGVVTGMTPGIGRASKMTAATVNATGRVISKSYTFNGYVDSVNRTVVYLAKHKKGISSEAAVQLGLKAAGDFSKMTPFERNVVRRIIPFYAWQRHITRLAFSLPVEAPLRVAWTLHLAELQNRLNPDTAGEENEFNEGTIPWFGGKRLSVRSLDPYGSSFWLDPSLRGAGYSLNPLLKLGITGTTGLSPNKGFKPVGTPESKFGEAPKGGFGLQRPDRLAQLATQSVPQVRAIQDLIDGEVPVRHETGQPRAVGKGSSKKGAKPTLTGRGRKETLARLLGVPLPEKEQAPKK